MICNVPSRKPELSSHVIFNKVWEATRATRAWTRRDNAPVMEAPVPPEAADASESSRADPRPIDQHLARQEAYVTVDALKNFMSTMTDAMMQQVSDQVKTVEAASSARPLPRFKFVPTKGCDPSYRQDHVLSHRPSERMREARHTIGDMQTWRENQDRSIRINTKYSHCPSHGGLGKSTMASTLYTTHSELTA